MNDKKLLQIFSDTLRTRGLSEEDELTLLKMLFPSLEKDKLANIMY